MREYTRAGIKARWRKPAISTTGIRNQSAAYFDAAASAVIADFWCLHPHSLQILWSKSHFFHIRCRWLAKSSESTGLAHETLEELSPQS